MIDTFSHGSLFSGIGGFDLAASWCGWHNVFQVEIDEWCRGKLKKNFPETDQHTDIFQFNGTAYRNRITVLSGGFPCQPFSYAGNRKGTSDDRNLWAQMFRVVREIAPPFVVAENVPGLLTCEDGMAFRQVRLDLESEGYEVQSLDIPASGKNAAHKRNRLWIVAYSHNRATEHAIQARRKKPSSVLFNVAHTTSQDDGTRVGTQKKRQAQQPRIGIEPSINSRIRCHNGGNIEQYRIIEKAWESHWTEWGIEPTICGDADGLPYRVDRVKALGNAVVPQVVFEIFRCIELSYIECFT